ncbi:MAG: ribonuclease R [Planctomycetaceae bacterium]|nr:ribonuclease R [Planctomycetaceae bacterium]
MNEKPADSENFEQRILDHVCRPNYRPVKPAVIAKKLEVHEDHFRLFKKALKKLIREKRLRWGSGHQVLDNSPPPTTPKTKNVDRTDRHQPGDTTPNPSSNGDSRWFLPANVQTGIWSDHADRSQRRTAEKEKREPKPGKKNKSDRKAGAGKLKQLVGRFRRHPSGHGSVTPTTLEAIDGQPVSAAFQSNVVDEKVFIRAPLSMDAATGDIVLIEYSRQRRGPITELSGAVLEILRRRSNRFVGTYWVNQGAGCVTVDGGQFPQPVLVGDATAKAVQPQDKVVIEMIRFPSQHDYGQAVIVEVLGQFGQPNLDTLMIMRQFDLPEQFPEDVIQESRDQAAAFVPEVQPPRRDLSSETIITIDPIDARDFDDAISLQRIENGHWRLGVHIADVSHFVRLGTRLDAEAYRRGTSTYLPDKVVPMLPEIISNHLASLQPDQLRFAMTAEIELTATGQVVATDFYRSGIKSVRRFTYEEVDEFLANREAWLKQLTPEVHQLLGNMHELAMLLRGRRMENGSLEMVLPEVKLELDRTGQVVGAKTTQNTESHQMIEEFMLLANVAVATKLADLGYHVLRRIHAPPNERRLSELTQFVDALGVHTDSLQNRFEIKRVLGETADSPLRHAVHYAVLRTMQKAIYGPKEVGHYALNFEHYCHFTSPIRRYPDLVIHRMLGDIIDGKRPNDQLQLLAVIGEHCSDREQNAEQAERELVKLKLLTYFSDKVGHEMHGIITGVESFGMFVQGVEIPAEGFVSIDNLPDDNYYFDDKARLLMGRMSRHQYRLGDQVFVRVHRVDLIRRQLDLVLLEPESPAKRRTKRRR